jgi:predicted Zn-dependent protease
MTVRSLLLGGSLALALGSCAVNPATGKRELMLVSESQELAMGKEYDQQVVAEMGLYDDPALASYIQQLGVRLASLSERPQLPWTFRLIDDPVVNAFAVPGGYIYITRGIMAQLESEAQLASVIGHEIGHVTARHTAEQITKQQVAGLGLGIASIFSPTAAGIAGGAMQILFLKFSRDDESQADELGFRYMRAAHYDPREAGDMFRQLERITAASGSRLPEWQSTHPDPGNRAANADARAAAIPTSELSGMIVRHDEYIQRLDGVVYGDDPRQGFFSGDRFLHPTLRFELTFPTNWPHANQHTAVLAQSPEKDAVVVVTVATEATPADAARGFFAGEGITGTATSGSINGLSTAGGGFTATTQQGSVQGEAQFISQGGTVFQVMGYASASAWAGRRESVRQTIASFRTLTDQQALAVQPWRVDIVRVDRTMTPAEFLQRYPGPVDLTKLMLLNQVDEGARFMSRNLVKRVVGQPLP